MRIAWPRRSGAKSLARLLRRHFHPLRVEALTITERQFPHRIRADLQRAMEQVMGSGSGGGDARDGQLRVLHFCGVHTDHPMMGINFAGMLGDYFPAIIMPPEYEEVDVGDDEPVRTLKNGLWLASVGEPNYRVAILMSEAQRHGTTTGVQFQVATPNDPRGAEVSQRFFKQLEAAVANGRSYRGKVLSLEQRDPYSGQASGIRVHRLRRVEREQVILPAKTLALLERNVIRFVAQRKRLAELGQATKKGLLFYGAPGTGKTHTIHYLAGALPGHTTLLITAEQVGRLDEYMQLARLLQPSVVVIEDVDLIARERSDMHSACEEVMLNKLLNEMDGLRESADILFILTTNRPRALEAALASRPGRVDQAIEFPLPDDEGRRKLVHLYGGAAELVPEVVEAIVSRTQGVSAAFIKELMRRAAQFQIERGETGRRIELGDVEEALNEMLFAGGSLDLALLGGGETKSIALPSPH
jgi:hypothetical protein